MKVCIAGGGRVGMYLAQSLLSHHHKVTIIEPQEALCRTLADTLDIPVICGDSLSFDTLRTADVASCDAFGAGSVCEAALCVVDAEAGPQPTTVKLWYAAEDLRLARAVFVNRLSRSEASFATTMDLLQERFGTRLGAVTLPWGEGEDFDGIIDLVRMKARHCNGTEAVESEIPEEYRAQAEEAHDHLCELVAGADDELMMKYLEGEETLTQEELEGLLSKAIAERIFVPVFAGDCIKEQGVNSLMDDIATYFPAPTDYGEMPLIDGDSLKISSDDDRPVAFVFKTLADPQQGRISFIKVLTGTLEPGLELINARTRKGPKKTIAGKKKATK